MQSETELKAKITPTPGPWALAHSSYANAPFVVHVGTESPKWDKRYPLSGVNWIAEVRHDESEQHEEQIANARLIAAAPDLLEACKRALTTIENLPPRLGEDRYEPLMQLTAAILKAEGNNPCRKR